MITDRFVDQGGELVAHTGDKALIAGREQVAHDVHGAVMAACQGDVGKAGDRLDPVAVALGGDQLLGRQGRQ